MTQRIANYCPHCGARLAERERFGRTRPVCPSCNHTVFFDPKVAVVAFITRGDEVLLVKRANDPGKGKWALPAGFVDYDEDPRAAAAREAEEETGVQVEIDELMDVLHRPDADGLADIVIAFSGHATGGALKAADDAEDAAWFPRNALPELALVTTQRLIGRWVEGIMS